MAKDVIGSEFVHDHVHYLGILKVHSISWTCVLNTGGYMVLGAWIYLSTCLLPVKPPGDQTCWLVGGAQGDCQQNKPISEQLVAQPHQVILEVVGQQRGKHLEEDWNEEVKTEKCEQYTSTLYLQQETQWSPVWKKVLDFRVFMSQCLSASWSKQSWTYYSVKLW